MSEITNRFNNFIDNDKEPILHICYIYGTYKLLILKLLFYLDYIGFKVVFNSDLSTTFLY